MKKPSYSISASVFFLTLITGFISIGSAHPSSAASYLAGIAFTGAGFVLFLKLTRRNARKEIMDE